MSRRVVVDASAIIELVLPRPRAHKLVKVLADAGEVMAPDLIFTDVANALWKYVRAGLLDADETVLLLGRAMDLIDQTVPDRDLAREALVAATTLGHPVYDMCYAVLARREGCTLCTLDRAFSKALATMSIPVVCPAR